MPSIIFVTSLPLWTMKQGIGKGIPSIPVTIKKYINEGWEVFLVTDEPTNEDGGGLIARDHVTMIPESWAKTIIPAGEWAMKHPVMRTIRHIFHRLNCKILTFNFVKAIENLLSKHKWEDSTILYSFDAYAVKACARLSKKYKLPLVTRFLGTWSAYQTITSKYNLVENIRHALVFSGLSQKADLVIMTDDGTRTDEVLKYLKNDSPALFLKNGLELLEMNLPKMKTSFQRNKFLESLGIHENSGCIFLVLSRLVLGKRVERSIDGFRSYLQKGNAGKLIIVGDGDFRATLEERVNRSGIQEHVVFTGAVEHSKVYDYMMACDIFLSLYDISNVGNPLLEALTLGKPIITLDVGATKTVITNGENGILLQYGDLPDLGSVMEKVAKDSELRARLGMAAEEYARKNLHSWQERMNIEFKAVEKLLH